MKPTVRRPNRLWISFEDAYPFYGCYGDPVASTPTVLSLAGLGIPHHMQGRAFLGPRAGPPRDCVFAARHLGRIPESEMVRGWYPDGKQPETAAPVFVPICEDNPGVTPLENGGTLTGPALLQLHCATQGASIGYTFDTGDRPRWQLYTTPIRLPARSATIRAKAIRIGYRESREAQVTLEAGGSAGG